MTGSGLRPETVATLLLCGSFGDARGDEGVSPLNSREFTEFVRVLDRLGIPLADLASEENRVRLREDFGADALYRDRIDTLLDRGTSLALAVERWESRSIWVLDRSHPDYPQRFRERLGDGAPPLLYGAGDVQLLNPEQHSVAVVGSRDIDEEAERFARDAGRYAALANVITVSGGAKGVDRTAVAGALEEGGLALAILPGDLERVSTSRVFRDAIADGRLVVASPYHPRAKFTVGNAMGRNRLIYSMADVALVVNSAAGSGGTWSGATQTLKQGEVPVYVRQSPRAPDGNRALLDLGAFAVEHQLIESSVEFRDWLTHAIESAKTPPTSPSQQLGLFH